ncbi:putative hydantoin utilization protein A [Amylocarpus encephaloides]|uniref:Hydantoin utilization protein A n=1 Tax=Amylocarpus encephaloides TaxID=45428 RepID=A0A9P8C6A2_9HELO|nr:putative hydantoin utilization protein A [Amylocarpus encephaloides]
MFENSEIDPVHVASVTIGTTHFINAVVEMDQARLAKVAIIRLYGPFGRGVPPCVDWPQRLRELISAYFCFVDGGLEVGGNLISDIDEEQIRKEALIIREKGIKSVVVNGIFSPVDVSCQQEERAAAILKGVYPGVEVIMSKDVANLGFLERENAAILNASILPFARKTIASFQSAISRLSLKCPVFITQNDGTIILASTASKLPIRTFLSGPTNSMRVAAFLTHNEIKETMMVVDTARQQTEISGVRTNFSYPDVRSIGLGGGSIVRRREDGTLTLTFGGDVATTTDYTVLAESELAIGNRDLIVKVGLAENLMEFKALVKKMLERAIDTMKTSAEDIPVMLVGGGAVIAPECWSGVANAIGAATARVSGIIDTIESTETKSTAQVKEEISKRVIKKAVENGAREDTVQVVEMDHIPLQYIANKSRFIIKAIPLSTEPEPVNGNMDEFSKNSKQEIAPTTNGDSNHTEEFDILTYKPKIQGREWIISEIYLAWITIGCYIVGTGGGGSPYSYMLRLREIMRKGGVVRVISPPDLKDGDLVACGGGKGSPTVTSEKLAGDEMMEAQNELYNYMNVKPDAVIALEIGGGNGLQAVALSRHTNQIEAVAESIIAQVGGDKSAKVLFKGKIVGVERTLRMGHVYGEVIIEGVDGEWKGRMKIPFKNENIVAYIVASVPDLICVIDAQNGEAIGTPEYRYGLLVIVLGIVASEKWTSTQRGLEIGGPKGFGMNDVVYKPLGNFVKPRSVINEYML